MPDQEDIITQQKLLQAYRETLAHYLEQLAILGPAHVPPGVSYGIRDARRNITHIKKILLDWGISTEDHPDDQANPDNGLNRKRPVTSNSGNYRPDDIAFNPEPKIIVIDRPIYPGMYDDRYYPINEREDASRNFRSIGLAIMITSFLSAIVVSYFQDFLKIYVSNILVLILLSVALFFAGLLIWVIARLFRSS